MMFFAAWVSPPPRLVLGLRDRLLGFPYRPGDCLQIAGDIAIVGLDQLQIKSVGGGLHLLELLFRGFQFGFDCSRIDF